ncbi:MAG: LptF/LptG family permease [Rickettsiales bacterium]
MKLFEKHVLSLQTKFFFIIVLTFTSILILTQLIKSINKYIGKGVSIFEILYMVLLFLPSMLVYVCPIAIFSATIFSYHRLITDNEVVILEANGLSKDDLAKVFFKFAFIVTAVVYITTTIINPLAIRAFHSQKLLSNENYVSSLLEEKVFNNVTKNMTIYIESKNEENRLKGILIYESTPNGDSIITAENANLAHIDGKILIFLENGTKMETTSSGHMNTLYFDKSKLNLSPVKMNSSNRVYSSEEWLLPQLIWSIIQDKEIDYQKKTEIQKRLAWPLLNLSTAAIAILAVVRMSYSRAWSSKSIVNGALLTAISMFMHFALASITQKNYYFSVLVYLNPLLWFFLCKFLITKHSTNLKFDLVGYLSRHRASLEAK